MKYSSRDIILKQTQCRTGTNFCLRLMLSHPKANKSFSEWSNFLENCFLSRALKVKFKIFVFAHTFSLILLPIWYGMWCDLTMGCWRHGGKLLSVVWHYNSWKSSLYWKRNVCRKTDICWISSRTLFTYLSNNTISNLTSLSRSVTDEELN